MLGGDTERRFTGMLRIGAGIVRELPGGLCWLLLGATSAGRETDGGQGGRVGTPFSQGSPGQGGVTGLLLWLGSCEGANAMLHGRKLQPLAVLYSSQNFLAVSETMYLMLIPTLLI